MKLVIIVVAVVFLYILIRVCFYKIDKTGRLTRKQVLEKAKEGDVILFAGKTFGEKMIMWWFGGDTSHVALVLGKDEDRLLYEADIGQGENSGVRLIKLDKKLERWRGEETFLIRNIEIKDKNKMWEKIQSNLGKGIDTNPMRWILGIESSDKMYCYEAVEDVI